MTSKRYLHLVKLLTVYWCFNAIENHIIKISKAYNVTHLMVDQNPYTPIPIGPESRELTRIDKYLDSWLNRTQFAKIITDSHSP